MGSFSQLQQCKMIQIGQDLVDFTSNILFTVDATNAHHGK